MPSRELLLPSEDRRLIPFTIPDPPVWPLPKEPIRSRIAYAAAHIVADPLAPGDPASTCAIDWDATLAYRRALWCYGFGVAEAMDTAQRGMGLDWSSAKQLIARSTAEAQAHHGLIACGAGTDQLDPHAAHALDAVIAAYEEQCGYVEPVILHWLGGMFDPALAAYWGSPPREAMATCLQVIRGHHQKIDGIKLSLLDASLEIEMRRQLPPGVRMYTGDDFAYPDLILGGAQGHSDALLGIFDAIAPAASSALQALDRGDAEEYSRILDPTVALSRTIFEAPTHHYKTGIVFLAYLNGYQRHFRMAGGRESARSIVHLSRVLMRAAEAGILTDPGLACQRMKILLDMSGVY
jgi:hypothetical protein